MTVIENLAPITRLTPAELNEINVKFWQIQQTRAEERLAEKAIRESALELLQGEELRGVQLARRLTLEKALEDAERVGKRRLVAQARKGGIASKSDALQELIEKIVARRLAISLTELIEDISRCEGIEVIVEIVEDTISFTNHNGDLRDAPLSGLKHRLTRARKKLRKKSQSR